MSARPITTAAARTGRPSNAEREASNPTAQALLWLETRLLDGAHAIGLFTTCHQTERLHDGTRDRILLDAIALGDSGAAWIEVRAGLMEAVRIDQLADAADAEGAQHVNVGIRRVHQRIGAFVERSIKALRAIKPKPVAPSRRNRPARRTGAVAVQMPMDLEAGR